MRSHLKTNHRKTSLELEEAEKKLEESGKKKQKIDAPSASQSQSLELAFQRSAPFAPTNSTQKKGEEMLVDLVLRQGLSFRIVDTTEFRNYF